MMKVTENFDWSEFESRGEPVPVEYQKNIEKVCKNLEVLRSHCGDKPITVVSGWRSAEHNADVGGAKKSQHLTGCAADIQIEGLTPRQVHRIIGELIKNGKMDEGGLGLYRTFTHYDIRGTLTKWKGKGII